MLPLWLLALIWPAFSSGEFLRLKIPFVLDHEIPFGRRFRSLGPSESAPALQDEDVMQQEPLTLPTFRPPGSPPSTAVTRPFVSGLDCSASGPEGRWSAWSVREPCTAECGACGRETRTRTCLSYNAANHTGCPCVGEYKKTRPCRIGVCPYPRPSCCPPSNLMYVNQKFACGPQEAEVVQDFVLNR